MIAQVVVPVRNGNVKDDARPQFGEVCIGRRSVGDNCFHNIEIACAIGGTVAIYSIR